MKKILAMVLALIMIMALCCTSAFAETKDVKTEVGRETITFMRLGTEPERKAHWEQLIEAFETENPDIDVIYEECPAADFDTKLNIVFASMIMIIMMCEANVCSIRAIEYGMRKILIRRSMELIYL